MSNALEKRRRRLRSKKLADEWEEWSPSWAPHVKGRYTRRTVDEVTRMPEPQQVRIVCTHRDDEGKMCGETWQTSCSSGNVRRHIQNFAMNHIHKDPLQAPKVVRPGSKRG